MTDVQCTKKECINYKGGYCGASYVYYDGRCQSYLRTVSCMNGQHSTYRRVHGRVKKSDTSVHK